MADYQKVEMGYPTNYQQPSVTSSPDDEVRRRQNRTKAYIAIGIFIVIQTIVISILGLTITKVKIQLGDIHDVQTLTAVPEPPLFDMSFATEIRVRNKNWGPYKYESGFAIFMYEGVPVGQLLILQGKVGMRSTKKMDAIVSVSGSGFLLGNTMLGTELNSEILKLTSTAKLDGKVELLGIFQKHKTAEMECSMVFNLETETVQRLKCE